MLDLARATGDNDLLITGHGLTCIDLGWTGDFHGVLEHAAKVLDLYDSGEHRHLADLLNHDLKTSAGIFSSIATWALGYPDRARRLTAEKDAHARERGHVFDRGFALTMGAHEFDRSYGLDVLRERAEECERLGREHSLPVLHTILAPALYGPALIREGRVAEGMIVLQAGIEAWEATGGKARSPILKAWLAEGIALNGDVDGALRLIDQQIVQVERPGWGERFAYAEILRLKGWMLSLMGDREGAEREFFASLDWARRQQAKSWELRTATSIARLWQSQGKRRDAYDLLARVYGWFTEGFGTRDLQEAKALLKELDIN
jgi:predicted ATPase